MKVDSSNLLNGQTVIITRAKKQESQTRKAFENTGAKVLDLPALMIGPPDEWGPLDDALAELETFHWIIFSSMNGVEAVEERLALTNNSLLGRSKNLKVAAVGKKTAMYLEELGVLVDFIPPKFVSDSLIENFPVPGYGLKMLIPRVQSGGRTLLAESFRSSGARVVEVPAYESKCPNDMPQVTVNALTRKEVNMIAFTSGKTAEHTSILMQKYFGDSWLEILEEVKIISIGPQTTSSCHKYFGRVNKEANTYNIEGLIQACIDSLNN